MTVPGEWQPIGDNHKVRVEGDLVYSVWNGPSTLEEVQAYHAIMERVIAEHGRVFCLIDMRKAHRPPPEARKWITEWSQRFRVTAVACFGTSFTVRTFANLLVRAIRLVKGPEGVIAFFDTEAQARAFLRGERARPSAHEASPMAGP
jgi:hypothetical protein